MKWRFFCRISSPVNRFVDETSHRFVFVRLAEQQGSEMRLVIIWLEEFHDDLDALLPGSSSRFLVDSSTDSVVSLVQDQSPKSREISVIGIHPLKNGLFRIALNPIAQR